MRVGTRVRRSTPSPEGALLKEYRVRANITQDELARKLGRTRSYVGLLEQSRVRISMATIHEIARVLQLKLYEEQLMLQARGREWSMAGLKKERLSTVDLKFQSDGAA